VRTETRAAEGVATTRRSSDQSDDIPVVPARAPLPPGGGWAVYRPAAPIAQGNLFEETPDDVVSADTFGPGSRAGEAGTPDARRSGDEVAAAGHGTDRPDTEQPSSLRQDPDRSASQREDSGQAAAEQAGADEYGDAYEHDSDEQDGDAAATVSPASAGAEGGSFAPTADSPPSAPPSLADRQGSGARPATNRQPIVEKRPPADAAPPDPATARPTPRALRAAAARRAAKDSDPHAPGRRMPEGPTARSALPRTAFHGLVGLTQVEEARPDLVPPADHPGSATIDLEPVHRTDDSPIAITESGAPAPSRGPAVPTRPGSYAGPGGPTRPPGRTSGRVTGRRRRRLQPLVAAFVGLLVLGGAGVLAVDRWRTSDDDSSLLGQADDSPTMLVGRASQAPPLEDSDDLPAMAPGHGTSGGALSSDGYWDAAPGDGQGGSGPDDTAPDDSAPDDSAPGGTAPDDAAPGDTPGAAEQDERPSDAPTHQPPGAGALPDSGADQDANSDSGTSTLLPVTDLTLGACVPGTQVAAGSYGPGGQIRVMDCTTRGSMELVGRTRATAGQASATDPTVVGGAACRRLAADELGVSGADLDGVRSLVPSRDAHAEGADEILCFMPPRAATGR
jgi:hypothetical protein